MPNEFRFDEKQGIIHYVYHGAQTAQTLTEFREKTNEVAAKLQARNQPVLMLIDITDMGRADSNVRQAGIELLRSSQGYKMAVVGASTFMRYLGFFVSRALGSKLNVEYFKTQEEAEAWLRS